MKQTVRVVVCCIFFYVLSPAQDLLQEADELFKAGKFSAARVAYERVLSEDPANHPSLQQMAKIALIHNDLSQAEEHARKILAVNKSDSAANWLMAETLRRQDHYAEAAPYFRMLKRDAVAQLMEAFQGLQPYSLNFIGSETVEIPFVATDPLPTVLVKVQGSDDGVFILDTGGAGVLLDKEFADEIGVKALATDTGTFAGGQRAAIDLGKVETMRVGDVEVSHVPVTIQNMRRYDAVAGGKKVRGILGTGFFSHFITTLNYVDGKLVLAKRSPENLAKLKGAAYTSKMPFWVGNTHILVAWGKINGKVESLLFIDTGLAMQGVSFTCPESMIQSAGFQPLEGNAVMGQGGGGRVRVVPFMISELQLGSIKQTNTMGITGAFPESLEYKTCGFRIGGLISHGFFRQSVLILDFDTMQLLIS